MNERSNCRTACNRRALLKNVFALTCMGGTATLLSPGNGVGALFAQVTAGRGTRGTRPADSKPPTLILLGTQGGPTINLNRAETASVLVVDGQAYLIDCGYGTLRALVESGIRLNDVRNIFLSHLHDDHTADLPALLSLRWTGGNTNPQPAAVYGPFGSKAMVEAAVASFKANAEIRMVDEGRTVRPEGLFSGHDLAAPIVTEVFHDERVTVRAVENTHFPERAKQKMPYRSLAYRFNTSDRSFVLSGDTAYSSGLVELARGADVFVCEAMTMALHERFESDARATSSNTESIGRHVLETHSSTEDVGRMASEAKVKTVVLYHLLPGSNPQRGTAPDDAYISGVRKFFDGEIIVGRDQMRI